MLKLNVRGSVRSGVPLVATVLAVFLAASQTFAQGTTGPNQKSFQEFEMSVTEGIVNRPLPFDVPFIVTGQIPAGVHAVRAYLRTPPIPLLPPADPQPVRRISCEGEGIWSAANEVGVWTAPPPGLVSAPAATPRFRILFPPLEVNTNYCVRFELQRVVTAAEADAFRRSAFTAIDQELRKVEFQSRNFTNEDVENLRQRLIAAVRATNSAIYAPPGTIFDSRATDADRTNAQRELVTRIAPALEPQFQRFLQIEAYERFVKSARAALDGLRAAAAPGSLLRRDAFVATLTDGDRNTLRQLLDGTPTVVTTFLGGENTLTNIWEVQSAQPCTLPQVDPLVATLRGNADFLFRLNAALLKAAEVPGDKAEADKLMALVSAPTGAGSSLGAAFLAIDGATLPAGAGAAPGTVARTAGIRDAVCARALAINAVALTLRTIAREEVTLIVTTTGDFASRHPWHFSVDVGLAIAPVIGEIFPYVGVNMYFRPVNRDARLSSLSEAYGRPVSTFSRRFSLMLGYTWTDNLLKTNKRLGLFNSDEAIGQSVENEPADAMLVAGVGLRINDVLRIAGGALAFKAMKTNPLLSDTDLKVTPFFSLSWDWDAVGNIRGLGSVMGFGNLPIPVAVTQRDPPPAPPAVSPAAPEPAPAAPAPAPAAPPVAPAPAPPDK